jgi:hypothetical protein
MVDDGLRNDRAKRRHPFGKPGRNAPAMEGKICAAGSLRHLPGFDLLLAEGYQNLFSGASDASVVKFGERGTFVKSNMPGLAALDLVLRRLRASMAGVAMDFEILRMHARDFAADASCLRVPAHMIPDLEFAFHDNSAQ